MTTVTFYYFHQTQGGNNLNICSFWTGLRTQKYSFTATVKRFSILSSRHAGSSAVQRHTENQSCSRSWLFQPGKSWICNLVLALPSWGLGDRQVSVTPTYCFPPGSGEQKGWGTGRWAVALSQSCKNLRSPAALLWEGWWSQSHRAALVSIKPLGHFWFAAPCIFES